MDGSGLSEEALSVERALSPEPVRSELEPPSSLTEFVKARVVDEAVQLTGEPSS